MKHDRQEVCMLKRSVLAAAMAVLFAASAASAGEPAHSFTVGPEVYWVKYKEPGVMRNEGVMYGVSLGYRYDAPTGLMLGADLAVAAGEVDYDSQGTGSMENNDDTRLEARLLAGYGFKPAQGLTFTPYAGLGYRFLRNDSAGKVSTTGDVGYERRSNYFYLPVGVAAVKALSGGWKVTGTAEFDWMFYGRQYSDLSGTGHGLPDIDNRQDHGIGLRASLGVEKDLSEALGAKASLAFEPFVRYWRIAKSELEYAAGAAWYEPKNKTTEIGAALSLRF